MFAWAIDDRTVREGDAVNIQIWSKIVKSSKGTYGLL